MSDLNYYGNYSVVPGYGLVWQPYFMDASWSPFQDGGYVYYAGAGYMWVFSLSVGMDALRLWQLGFVRATAGYGAGLWIPGMPFARCESAAPDWSSSAAIAWSSDGHGRQGTNGESSVGIAQRRLIVAPGSRVWEFTAWNGAQSGPLVADVNKNNRPMEVSSNREAGSLSQPAHGWKFKFGQFGPLPPSSAWPSSAGFVPADESSGSIPAGCHLRRRAGSSKPH